MISTSRRFAIRFSNRTVSLSPFSKIRYLSDIGNNVTTSSSRQQEREAELAAMRARRREIVNKRAMLNEHVQTAVQTHLKATERSEEEKEQERQKQLEEKERIDSENKQHYERRDELLVEASSITKSLYLSCMRSLKILRPGNEHDEKEFNEREEKQLKSLDDMNFSDMSGDDLFSLTAPVDRENELESRYEYYYEWTKENFIQESECLQPLDTSTNTDRITIWKEKDIDRYYLYVKKGEKARRKLLKEFKFDDPYASAFDHDRVRKFKTDAHSLIRDVYKTNGWVLESIIEAERAKQEVMRTDHDDDAYSDDES